MDRIDTTTSARIAEITEIALDPGFFGTEDGLDWLADGLEPYDPLDAPLEGLLDLDGPFEDGDGDDDGDTTPLIDEGDRVPLA